MLIPVVAFGETTGETPFTLIEDIPDVTTGDVARGKASTVEIVGVDPPPPPLLLVLPHAVRPATSSVTIVKPNNRFINTPFLV